MKKVTELVAELAAPAVAEQGCTLWDVEYVREAGQWYLRLYLDKDGGVDILDCEAVSRKVSDLLDQADPIEGSYTFEVSSAGAERPLKRPSDFQRFLGTSSRSRLAVFCVPLPPKITRQSSPSLRYVDFMASTLSRPFSSGTRICLNGWREDPRIVPPLVRIPEKSEAVRILYCS